MTLPRFRQSRPDNPAAGAPLAGAMSSGPINDKAIVVGNVIERQIDLQLTEHVIGMRDEVAQCPVPIGRRPAHLRCKFERRKVPAHIGVDQIDQHQMISEQVGLRNALADAVYRKRPHSGVEDI